MYLTHSPCKECSKLILQSGISRVVYLEDYKDLDGVNFLRSSKVEVDKLGIYE
jgi:dCMP deaminase